MPFLLTKNMIYNMQDNQKIAYSLREANINNNCINPINLLQPSIDQAYKIQEINTKFWINSGLRPIGYKIGLTSKQVQKQLNINVPDMGILFHSMALLDKEIISFDSYIQPKLEGEIAFILGSDIQGGNKSIITDVISAIDYMLPVIEIIDSRICNWNINIYDTIADNASSASFVLGNIPRKLKNINLETCSMSIYENNNIVSSGTGQNCLNNPLNAVLWLSKFIHSQNKIFKKGDIILSGALGPVINIKKDTTYYLSITNIGNVTITFN
jgi:2-keto-4-pentenoate hydratase